MTESIIQYKPMYASDNLYSAWVLTIANKVRELRISDRVADITTVE